MGAERKAPAPLVQADGLGTVRSGGLAGCGHHRASAGWKAVGGTSTHLIRLTHWGQTADLGSQGEEAGRDTGAVVWRLAGQQGRGSPPLSQVESWASQGTGFMRPGRWEQEELCPRCA